MNIGGVGRITVLTIIFFTLVTTSLIAEESNQTENTENWSCCRGYRYGNGRGRYWRNYDLRTTEILDGEIVSLVSFSSRRGFPGTHLMVQTDKETIEVHLAPSWFLAEQDFELTPQDKITIIGSRIKLEGQETIVAREIKKGDRTLLLRDRDGFPVWRRSQIPTTDK